MTSGGREVLKWIALVLMTGDHVNKVLLHGSQPWLTDLARVVFPIFAVVLAWNVARHPDQSAMARCIRRTFVAAVLVQPFHALAFGYWFPLNILFTLAIGLLVAYRPTWWVVLLAGVCAAAFVDYAWPGVVVVASAVLLAKRPEDLAARCMFLISLLLLCWINGNAWALLSVPLLIAGSMLDVTVPRWRWTFLGYYAGHLAVLSLLAAFWV